MDRRVRWLAAAADDVDAIASHIERDSPAYASAVAERLRQAAAELKRFPLGGRVVPELELATVRQRVVYSYRLIYHVADEFVTVLAVIHGARLLPDSMRDRLSDIDNG